MGWRRVVEWALSGVHLEVARVPSSSAWWASVVRGITTAGVAAQAAPPCPTSHRAAPQLMSAQPSKEYSQSRLYVPGGGVRSNAFSHRVRRWRRSGRPLPSRSRCSMAASRAATASALSGELQAAANICLGEGGGVAWGGAGGGRAEGTSALPLRLLY